MLQRSEVSVSTWRGGDDTWADSATPLSAAQKVADSESADRSHTAY